MAAWSGLLTGQRPGRRPRACARRGDRGSAAGASAASRSISRDTLKSEVTGPNLFRAARSRAMSARQFPPTAGPAGTSTSKLPES